MKELSIRHYVESAVSYQNSKLAVICFKLSNNSAVCHLLSFIAMQFNHEITKQLPNKVLQLESLSLKLSNPCALSKVSCVHISQIISLRFVKLNKGLRAKCMG